MKKKRKREAAKSHPLYGTSFEMTAGGVTYHYWLKVTRKTLTIRDAGTLTVLNEVPLAQVGIKSRNGKFVKKKSERDTLVVAYVLAWMVAQWAQTRH